MLNLIKETTTLLLVIPFTLIIGLILSVRYNWTQLTLLPTSFSLIFSRNKEPKTKTGPSTLSAISAVLGGNLGTGNIAGIAVALSMGGPGALFWMWVMALLASIFKFSECYLSLKYTKRCKAQEHTVGGPLFYMQNICSKKQNMWKKALPLFYSLSLLCAAYGVGNVVQVQSLTLPLERSGISPLHLSFLLAAVTFIITSGGLQLFHRVVSSLVPIMALIYIATCMLILSLNWSALPNAIYSIFAGALGSHVISTQAITSGVCGGSFSLFKSLQVGFDRGLFATDAGSGIAGILHAPVKERYQKLSLPLSQGMASLLSPILVMAICTLTGLVILVSKVDPLQYESTNLCVEAFSSLCHTPISNLVTFFNSLASYVTSVVNPAAQNTPDAAITLQAAALDSHFGRNWGGNIVTVTLFFFAFTTILTWSRCAEETLHFYCKNKKWPIVLHRLCFAGVIPLSTLFTVQTLWQIADLALNAMLLSNLIALFLLRSKVETTEIKTFFKQKKKLATAGS